MDITQELAKTFPEITRTVFETERRELYLRIEVKLSDLEAITKLTRKIIQFIDDKIADRNYFVDVYSAGTEQILDTNYEKHQNKRVKIKLHKPVNDKIEYEGVIERVAEDEIFVRWNAKGQMRLQSITKKNIELIKLTAKL